MIECVVVGDLFCGLFDGFGYEVMWVVMGEVYGCE